MNDLRQRLPGSLYSPYSPPFLPEIGLRVQLRERRFPDTYLKCGTVVSRCGLGRVSVRLDDGTERRFHVMQLHRLDIHPPLVGT